MSELFQGSIVANEIVNNDPDLKPEKSWTTELTAERGFAGERARHPVPRADARTPSIRR